MNALTTAVPVPADAPPPVVLGGPVALAESAWMGAAQASDVLEPLRITAHRWV